MKKILFAVLFTINAHFTFGQTLDSLQGQWIFESIYHTEGEKADSSKDKMASKMFESMSFTFKEFDKFTLSMFNKDEEGSFTFKAKKNTIVIYAESKKVVLEILEFEGNKMAVQFSSMKFWMVRELRKSYILPHGKEILSRLRK